MTAKMSEHLQGLPYVLVLSDEIKNQVDPEGNQKEFRVGDLCPDCENDLLDFNGLLSLECETCRFTINGCFT